MAISALVKEGMERARLKGVHIGRPPIPQRKIKKILQWSLEDMPIKQIAKNLRVTQKTVHNYLKKYEKEKEQND